MYIFESKFYYQCPTKKLFVIFCLVFDDDYCRKYLRDLRDDSYIKIYDTDSVLLKEWDIRSYDPAEPNPFDCNYYDYSLYDEQYGTYHEWVFVITEDMLNR